jgi:hypothetical protein
MPAAQPQRSPYPLERKKEEDAARETAAAINKAEQIALAEGRINSRLNREERQAILSEVQSLPDWQNLDQDTRFRSILGSVYRVSLPAQRTSASSLGRVVQFRDKNSGEELTGVEDKLSGGYRVGRDFYPFGQTEPLVDIPSTTSLPYIHYDRAKKAKEKKLGRPLTPEEDLVLVEEARITPANPTLEATRQMNLALMNRVLNPVAHGDLPETQQTRLSRIAKQVLGGSLTYQQAISSLGNSRANLAPALVDAIEKEGGIVLPLEGRKQVNGVITAKGIVAEIENLGNNIINARDLKEKAYWTELLRSKLGTFAVPMARARGEVGTMTDQDVDRAKALVPGFIKANFAPAWFKREIQWAYQMLDRQMISIAQGYSTILKPEGAMSAGGQSGSQSTATDIEVGDTATDPNTGKKIRWDGEQWQPIQ